MSTFKVSERDEVFCPFTKGGCNPKCVFACSYADGADFEDPDSEVTCSLADLAGSLIASVSQRGLNDIIDNIDYIRQATYGKFQRDLE